MLLAKGKAPDEKTVNKPKLWVTSVFTGWVGKYLDPVERDARFRELCRQTTSWVSFTMMCLNDLNRFKFWQIEAQLNPMYEEYIPPHLLAYSSEIGLLWRNVARTWQFEYREPLIVPRRGM